MKTDADKLAKCIAVLEGLLGGVSALLLEIKTGTLQPEGQLTKCRNYVLQQPLGDEKCKLMGLGGESKKVKPFLPEESLFAAEKSLYDSTKSTADSVGMDTQRKVPPYAQIVANYNVTCISLPKCSQLSEARRVAIRQRFREQDHPQDAMLAFFQMVEDSDFLTGRSSPGGFRATFDWLMRPANAVKVLEGNYANRGPSKHTVITDKERAANEHQY